ncbi:MAG: hypothetical protein HN348_03235 [Proteobacteria bacterium]|nr:hypothetical protein [Pseudomonadota bacterium]
MIVRSSLYALGRVQGRREQPPQDVVAAWVLGRYPDLSRWDPGSSRAARIRATSAIIDRMVTEEVDRVAKLDGKLSLWVFGGGFDARWNRLMPALRSVLDEYHEVEQPSILHFKNEVLAESAFSLHWKKVQKHPLSEGRWTCETEPGGPGVNGEVLAVLQGLWGRLSAVDLRALLERIRHHAPKARVIVDLPGPDAIVEGPWWPRTKLAEMGWGIDEEVRMGQRASLITPARAILCPGRESIRIARLSAR